MHSEKIKSAIFQEFEDAERAVAKLRAAGVEERAISVLQRKNDRGTAEGGEDADTDTKASGAAKGMGVGAGVGALAGAAALAIPGVGPFIALGAVAETLGLIGSSVVASAAVGAAAGGISGALMDYGVSEEDAKYYDSRIREGDVWVGVNTDETRVAADTIEEIMEGAGGRIRQRSMAREAY